jgi:hypothetical protein
LNVVLRVVYSGGPRDKESADQSDGCRWVSFNGLNRFDLGFHRFNGDLWRKRVPNGEIEATKANPRSPLVRGSHMGLVLKASPFQDTAPVGGAWDLGGHETEKLPAGRVFHAKGLEPTRPATALNVRDEGDGGGTGGCSHEVLKNEGRLRVITIYFKLYVI